MNRFLFIHQQNFLSTNRHWLCMLAITAMLSCKKEMLSETNDMNLSTMRNSSGFMKKPDIIVHKGQSIQSAVDAAAPGFVIQIQPGIYKEAIVVNKPGIQLIGVTAAGHEKVIIQNPGDEENGITVRGDGDGFVLKNVTIRDFEENGVFMIRVDNFLLSHVTTINDGEYGLFPLFCNNGVVEFCSATGHSDTGIYIGQSTKVTLQFNSAFANVNGLEIENSSNILVTRNIAFDNVCGILAVLLPGLNTKSSSDITIALNIVDKNNHVNFATPGEGFESFVPSGSGILVVGTDNTTVKQNSITGNNFVGVATVSTLLLGGLAGLPPEAFNDIEPNPDGAKITGNIVLQNGAAPPPLPLPGVDILWDGSGVNNCWSNNLHSSSFPAVLPACL